MALRFKVPALVLFVFSAIPFAACGDSNPNAGTCSSYCALVVACDTPDKCTLADPGAAQQDCVTSCEAGFAALSTTDRAAFDPCIDCLLQAAGGMCPTALPGSTCNAQCDSAAANAAGDKFGKAADASATANMDLCTNGRVAFGATACTGSGDGTSCTSACCNGDTCSTPDVAFTCTGTSLDQCTCTAGKNKGKTFQGGASCGADPWNECNL